MPSDIVSTVLAWLRKGKACISPIEVLAFGTISAAQRAQIIHSGASATTGNAAIR